MHSASMKPRVRKTHPQLLILRTVRKAMPPAKRVTPDPKRTAARKRVKRIDPTDTP